MGFPMIQQFWQGFAFPPAAEVSRKDAKVSLRRKENLRLGILILSALA